METIELIKKDMEDQFQMAPTREAAQKVIDALRGTGFTELANQLQVELDSLN